jgi:SPP1 gp7 family putative phage head morphogenesis protein
MARYSKDEELDFIESLFNEADEQLKEIYQEQKQNRDDLLQEIANVMLTFTIVDAVMKLTVLEKNKLSKKFLNLITKYANNQANLTIKVITNLLTQTVNNTYSFYSYNAKLKDVEKIINSNFKGKHFSTRVWDNEQEVAKYLNSQIQDFLQGKINVNDIKKNIEQTFNTSAYNAKRLVHTETSRCSRNAFDRFCIEVGVKKVKYVATLDSKLCSDCESYHDEVFYFDNKIELPRHPLCRCYYTIES